MRRVWIAAGVCALVLAVTGCGPRVAPEQMVGAQETGVAALAPEDASPTPAPGAEATSEPQPGSDGTGAPAATQAPSASPAPSYGPKHNNGAVRIELSATCVKPGDLLVITFRTPPKAGLGMIIGYSDNQAHGAMLTGESDANGVYVWRVPIDPTVPDGDAKVLVTSTGPNWQQEGGGTADAVFRVARAGC